MSIGRRTRFDRVFDGVNILIMALIMLITLYPLYFTIIASFSDPYEVVCGNVYLFPKGFSLDAYKEVFAESRLWTGYRNSIYYTSVGVVFNLLLTIPAAYTLSKKKLPMRNIIAVYFLIPMYFSGGLIPTYLQVKSLQLLNKPYTLIFLGGVSIYNVVVTRVFFETTISEELYESARIDGASDFRMFFSIALPLSAPILAVMALYYAVGRWNDYYMGRSDGKRNAPCGFQTPCSLFRGLRRSGGTGRGAVRRRRQAASLSRCCGCGYG